MRKLGLKDAFAVARIIKAADMRKEIIAFASDVRGRTGEKNAEKIGMEFFLTLINSVADESVEKKIYELYADIKGVTVEEVSVVDFATLKADIKELIEKNDLMNFFRSVSALMSAQQSS